MFGSSRGKPCAAGEAGLDLTRVKESILIRAYQESNQPGIEWLYMRTPPWGRTYPRPQAVPDEIKHLSDHYEQVLVAVENDGDGEAVVGMVAIEGSQATTNLHVPPPDFIGVAKTSCRLHWVLVAPERWRRGIGRMLTQTAIDWARGQGYESMVLETTPEQLAAVVLYKGTGFVQRDGI
jgi:ribosomal protein S18 acetylase RimI-like enzyme